jgi:hypothetical protein
MGSIGLPDCTEVEFVAVSYRSTNTESVASQHNAQMPHTQVMMVDNANDYSYLLNR